MHCRSAVRSGFNPVSITVMVLGFVFAWPLGLMVLAYILWGERWGWRGRVDAFLDGLRDGLRNGSFAATASAAGFRTGPSGNSAFDAYRARELERLEAERRRLEEERRDFETYMSNLRRARDQEEFDRFKADRTSRRHPDGDSGI